MPNHVYAGLGTSIFARMSALAVEHGAINLGQGFPEFPGPRDVIDAAAAALVAGSNQYAPMPGTPDLRRAIADHYRRHQGVELDWQTEITVTSGATEALAAVFLALIEPGDEVILFQPTYDSYAPVVRRAGGVPRFIRLAPPDWRIDAAALADTMTPRTRLIVVNTPHNPAATIVGHETLQRLAEQVVRNDLIVVSDEVWEHIVFDQQPHHSLLALPELRDRTVKIGSAGKIFSMTGWKIGWACAAPPLTELVARAHQFLTFSSAPNLQQAVAFGLGKDDAFFADMRARFQRSRDRLASGLAGAGYAVLPCAGSYFLNIDLPASGIEIGDTAFCERSVREVGVAAIPNSAFYAEDPVTTTVRLCFAKDDAMIDAAIARLADFRSRLTGKAGAARGRG